MPTDIDRSEIVKSDADGSLRLTTQNGNSRGPEIKYMPNWAAFR
ncbi:MAG: hypothetical protein RIB64_14120 [Arenibacter algicola]